MKNKIIEKIGRKIQFQYYARYFMKLLQAFAFACPIAIVLILLIYSFLPKEANICLYSTPYDFILRKASDIDYWGKTDNLYFFYDGTISMENVETINILYDDGMTVDIPAKGDVYNVSFQCTSLEEDIPCIISFDEQIVFQNSVIIPENCYPIGKVQLTNGGYYYEYQEDNNDFNLEHCNTFVISKDFDSPCVMEDHFCALLDTNEAKTMHIEGDFEIWSDDECIISSDECSSVQLELESGNNLVADFEAFTTRIDWNNNVIYALTHCDSFGVMPDASDDLLRYTYLNTQTDYKVDSISVEADACKGSYFDANFKLDKGVPSLRLMGSTKKVSIAQNTLVYNIRRFVAENVSAIIIGVFTAITGAFITLAQNDIKKE